MLLPRPIKPAVIMDSETRERILRAAAWINKYLKHQVDQRKQLSSTSDMPFMIEQPAKIGCEVVPPAEIFQVMPDYTVVEGAPL